MSDETVYDAITSFVSPFLRSARKGDADAGAEVIEALATALGRAIAIAANGDETTIDTLLSGAENHIATEASQMANMIGVVKTFKNGK